MVASKTWSFCEISCNIRLGRRCLPVTPPRCLGGLVGGGGYRGEAVVARPELRAGARPVRESGHFHGGPSAGLATPSPGQIQGKPRWLPPPELRTNFLSSRCFSKCIGIGGQPGSFFGGSRGMKTVSTQNSKVSFAKVTRRHHPGKHTTGHRQLCPL